MPSLTVKFGHEHIHAAGGPDPVAMGATRIEGGVLVSGSRSHYSLSVPEDQLPVAVVNHDGAIRWSRCVDGSRVIETLAPAPQYRPTNVVLLVQSGPQMNPTYRFVQLSLATGAEQPIFAATMQSVASAGGG